MVFVVGFEFVVYVLVLACEFVVVEWWKLVEVLKLSNIELLLLAIYD
jgi:hypothetical protein